jgi:hypothetical protein
MTFLGAALSSLAEGGYKPRLTDFRGGKNAKPLYELSRRCNDLWLRVQAPAQSPTQSPGQPEGWCSKHSLQMTQNHKNGRSWWSHRLADGTWCKGK